jgi:hypothetical protein
MLIENLMEGWNDAGDQTNETIATVQCELGEDK